MRNFIATIVCVGLGLVVCGCESSGISPRDPQGMSTNRLLTELCMEAATQPSVGEHGQQHGLNRPAKIAVAQVGEIAPPAAMIQELEKSPERFASVTAVPALTDGVSGAMYAFDRRNVVDGERRPQFVDPSAQELEAYRGLAAQVGADYLVLVGGTADTLEEATPLSVLDLTIVGMFVVPSRSMSGDVKAIAVAIDAHTGKTVAIQTAEAEGKSLVPAVQVDSERVKLIEKLRDEATVKIAKGLNG